MRAGLIDGMENAALVAATDGLDADDLADLIKDLPGAVIEEVLSAMDQQNRERLVAVLHYPEDTAGGLMNVDVVTVRADVTLDVVLRYLRLHIDIPDTTDSLFVVDREDNFKGVLPLSALLTNDPDLLVAGIMVTEYSPASPRTCRIPKWRRCSRITTWCPHRSSVRQAS